MIGRWWWRCGKGLRGGKDLGMLFMATVKCNSTVGKALEKAERVGGWGVEVSFAV